VSLPILLAAALREIVAIEPGLIVTYERESWVLRVVGNDRRLHTFAHPVSERVTDADALRLVYRRAAEWLLSEATHCHGASVQALRVEIQTGF
jgi:hypothetical protein